jgi:flavin-dependent dehydrogenase
MKQIEEPARNVPVVAETDVLVVGGGPGGLSAALAAAAAGQWEMRARI